MLIISQLKKHKESHSLVYMVENLVCKQGKNNNSKQLQNAYQVSGTVLYCRINSFNPH